jgi:hypothetical protein
LAQADDIDPLDAYMMSVNQTLREEEKALTKAAPKARLQTARPALGAREATL